MSGEYGYLVIGRIDENHVLIALEPGTDYQYKTNALINHLVGDINSVLDEVNGEVV